MEHVDREDMRVSLARLAGVPVDVVTGFRRELGKPLVVVTTRGDVVVDWLGSAEWRA